MKSLKVVRVFGLVLLAVALFSACNKSEPVSPASASKSGSMMLKVSGKSSTSGSVNNIPLSSGNLKLVSFNVNLSQIKIQENSGFDGEQQGDNNDGNSGGSETESPDLVLSGPFSFDIANGIVNIGTFDVYPGVFKQVDLFFLQSSNQPFNGGSLVINGSYTDHNGAVIPLILKSKFSQSFQTQIAGSGVTVKQNSKLPITIAFNFDKMFAQLDFSKAVISNNSIIIDSDNNTNILALFEANLSKSIELENQN
ncbi:MAG: hypothetical protein ACYC4T_02840 [Melioribacteraceae bacterium]